MESKNRGVLTVKYLISAGSNLSQTTQTPHDLVKYACELLENAFGSVKISRFYANPAHPAGSGPDFVNAAMALDTQIDAAEMLDFLHSVEAAIGRKRQLRWGPRVIDLDLIASGSQILPDLETFALWRGMSEDEQQRLTPTKLILPHPRLQDRAFVLLPLRDIAPDWQHPVTGLTVRQMCDRLNPAAIAACTVISEPQAPLRSNGNGG